MGIAANPENARVNSPAPSNGRDKREKTRNSVDGDAPPSSDYLLKAASMGRALSMEQEQPVRVGRRLAAIVAADVAGYSRLMGLDEVGTARTLREHRKITDALVAKHGGRLVKTTGDGVLLEFPSGSMRSSAPWLCRR